MSVLTVSEISRDLVDRLRACRVRQGFTQEEMSERADIPLSTYKRFEQKNLISLDGFIKVAIALGVADGFQSLFQPSVTETEFTSLDEVERTFASSSKSQARARSRSRSK
ncbi:MAG: XRE family transcriptional regulator [Puniceicoccaceae bacterium]|nr:MAG: XRE family transcriptional regulator [Puniceicoccaceae bacterium]